MTFKEKQHGGSTNVDIETLKYAIKRWGVKSMIDVGCGTGGQVIEGQNLGIDSYGVDGSKDIPSSKNFQRVDYRVKASNFDREFDLGWSVEFVEHVEEKCIPIFMKDFQKCRRVILTAAPKFWGGKNHVNEQSEVYWLDKFNQHGFTLNFKETFRVRKNSVTLMNGEVRPPRQQFIKIRGLVFERNDVI
jgi:SAM-dependent methyltransferase